ncbi:MAG: four helix bundle protein [Deltaproteobacteria bacterium]|nr:four helix bundle protein [Deltaproteobacteria bacterium]
MKSFRDPEVYTLSYKLAVRVHKISPGLPKYELYEEGSQLRRSSKGVTSCIVEGYGRRSYKADFIRFLIYAQASCDETILHLNIINDTHDLNNKEIETMVSEYKTLGRKINRFIKYVEGNWK